MAGDRDLTWSYRFGLAALMLAAVTLGNMILATVIGAVAFLRISSEVDVLEIRTGNTKCKVETLKHERTTEGGGVRRDGSGGCGVDDDASTPRDRNSADESETAIADRAD